MYRAKAAVCDACKLEERCTHSKNGRTVYRPRGEDHYDRVRAYRGTEAYEKALRKREVWVEPLFAEAKAWHGMDKVRLRTLGRVNAEALMVAARQNLKRLLAIGRRGPKRKAQAPALRPPNPYRTCTARRFRRRRLGDLSCPASLFCNRLERLLDIAKTRASGTQIAPLTCPNISARHPRLLGDREHRGKRKSRGDYSSALQDRSSITLR
jgi:hypothetical protein